MSLKLSEVFVRGWVWLVFLSFISKMLPGKVMFWYTDNEALHQKYLSVSSCNEYCQEWGVIWNTCFLK